MTKEQAERLIQMLGIIAIAQAGFDVKEWAWHITPDEDKSEFSEGAAELLNIIEVLMQRD